MSDGTGGRAWTPDAATRLALGLGLGLAAMAVLAAAAWVPFGFPSSSIQYKFGVDRALVLTGKVMGMTAGALMLLQWVLAARIRFLDRIFSLNRLYAWHRVNAVALAVTALLHPLFIFAPEDVRVLRPGFDLLPEMVGALLLVCIGLIAVTGFQRLFLGIAFHRWRSLHRWGTFLAAGLLVGHVLTVSDSFASGLPRLAVLAAAGCFGLLLVWTRARFHVGAGHRCRVQTVRQAGRDAVALELLPISGRGIHHLPGQFAFLKCRSEGVTAEEHPFTLCSTPTRPPGVQFVIRCRGDWTRNAGKLAAGDRVHLHGPFGRFSHLTVPPGAELIFVAGGIGITPMLSMLRFMADANDTRPVTLVWSNRTREDIIFSEELEEFGRRLANLRIAHVLTRSPGSGGRLDQEKLAGLLGPRGRDAHVFVCGPETLMHGVRAVLVRLGFARKRIHLEHFRL